MNLRLGRDDQFDDNLTVRLKAIDVAIESYQRTSTALRAADDPLLSSLTEPFFVLLPQGNQPNLMADTRAIFHASRELLDFYLGRLWRATGNSTPRKFRDFINRLAAGEYDARPEPIFGWLKQNISRLFTIRTVRNELKTNPSGAHFNFVTDHFEMKISLPFTPEDEPIIPFINLGNVEEAKANRRFFYTANLDQLIPETRVFWDECGRFFDFSFPRGDVSAWPRVPE